MRLRRPAGPPAGARLAGRPEVTAARGAKSLSGSRGSRISATTCSWRSPVRPRSRRPTRCPTPAGPRWRWASRSSCRSRSLRSSSRGLSTSGRL